jgi:hypothetical protein
MPEIKSKFKKVLKVIGMIFGIIVVLGIVSFIFVYKMDNRPFPIKSLECKDGKVFGNFKTGELTSFQVRVTNKESFGVKDIKIKFEFFGKDKEPIDGATITLYENVPPMTTRLLQQKYFRIEGLPPEGDWTWRYSITDAKRTWIFD